MRDLTGLGFSKESAPLQLSVSVNGQNRKLPDAYTYLLSHQPPEDLELGFKFIEATGNEEWEGQVIEFMRYDETNIQDALVSPPTNPTRQLFPIAADAAGNYVYLDVTTEEMPIIDVGYESGALSVVAGAFTEFLDKLYLMDE